MGIYDSFQGQSDVSGASAQLQGIGNSVQQESAMSQKAQDQWSGSYALGTQLQNQYTAADQGTPEQQYQNQGPVSQALYNDVLAQAQNPTAGWQSALSPQLTQAQNQINEYYNSRGLINSGIAIGSMGTAGVDLAIQNAQNEMTYQQQSLQNAQALSQNAGLVGQQNSQNLQNLYQNQQATGLQGQQLAQQGYQEGAGYIAEPSEAQLGYGYGQMAAGSQEIGSGISSLGSLGSDMMMSNALSGGGAGNMSTANNQAFNQNSYGYGANNYSVPLGSQYSFS
jgi:hypothetical protein